MSSSMLTSIELFALFFLMPGGRRFLFGSLRATLHLLCFLSLISLFRPLGSSCLLGLLLTESMRLASDSIVVLRVRCLLGAQAVLLSTRSNPLMRGSSLLRCALRAISKLTVMSSV